MAKKEDKYAKKRLKASYITSVISITLVLFVLGSLGLVVLQAKLISKHVRENIQLTVFMKNDVKEADMLRLKKYLDAKHDVKSTKLISSEEAAEVYSKELGEDFIKFLDGENPLHASIEVFLHEEYANVDSLAQLATMIETHRGVEEVKYHKSYVETINNNIGRITMVFLAVVVLLLLISIVLINNTIRLSVYSSRFIIRAMQLIGATQGFIRKPFVWQGIIQGIISSILTIGILIAILYKINAYFPEMVNLHFIDMYLVLFGSIILVGVLISWWSSSLAVRKYLRMTLDNIYLS
ncbi:MAG: permease-like cell division protein FtsX [Bacteroidales bacterium]|nr:permease-like cell division protein FtsX [Bacteroidales bacterium]